MALSPVPAQDILSFFRRCAKSSGVGLQEVEIKTQYAIYVVESIVDVHRLAANIWDCALDYHKQTGSSHFVSSLTIGVTYGFRGTAKRDLQIHCIEVQVAQALSSAAEPGSMCIDHSVERFLPGEWLHLYIAGVLVQGPRGQQLRASVLNLAGAFGSAQSLSPLLPIALPADERTEAVVVGSQSRLPVPWHLRTRRYLGGGALAYLLWKGFDGLWLAAPGLQKYFPTDESNRSMFVLGFVGLAIVALRFIPRDRK